MLQNDITINKHQSITELQFQLILGGGGGGGGLGGEEADGEAGGQARAALPPILTPLAAVPPIQAEILDNEIKELQAALHEAKSRNIYLSGVVEQQKK